MMLKAVIYGYMNNLYSCRKIESALKRDIHFIWLAGYEQPDFNTINRFRNRVKEEINHVFTQLVIMLAEKGFITLDVEYIDGTKIESKANRYTFVWRKSTEKNRAKLTAKIKALLEQIDEAVAQENAQGDNVQDFTPADLMSMADELNRSLQEAPKPVTKEEKRHRKEKEKQIRQLKEHAGKLNEYDEKLRILDGRNSYSKTDHDATFMRMKENAMNNGQTKPGYNLQLGTENQFILDFGLFQSPGDPLTMITFFNSFAGRYHRLPDKAVADSGYGSEENYRFMEEAGIAAYVKYNWFHREQRMHYEPNPFSPQSSTVNSACTMNPIRSVRSLYTIMPKVTITSARWGSTWSVSALYGQRRKADMSPKVHATRRDAVRDAHSGDVVSRPKETGSSKSTTVWTNTGGKPERGSHQKRESNTGDGGV